jgi:hypothetical protein
VEKNCIEGKKPPEDGCMEPKHVVEEESSFLGEELYRGEKTT